ncbi:AbrB family transcriptional regulator [Thermaerobacillus caldiproteolyticus]|uniref:AbrB family transcriptional regulator n=1 Tax=Thermaerobacillus caldiproteolyticus TaxID=247480 RepID=UPI00188A431A|nr:AbrB family transcriptional regulator [Anoxybacillus caldiproteolyticus]QPA32206.1 AbrB family transcriptional regulator [Anoxybacillus caldiproteolyticus]
MKVLETYLVAGLTGLLFYMIHSPIPWMLGAITGMLVWKTVTKRTLVAPKFLSNIGLIILGTYFGLSFTKDTFLTIAPYIVPFLVVAVLMIAITITNSIIVAKWIHVDKITSVFASVPGGLSEMVAASESLNANTALVTIFQTIRLLTVVFLVPTFVVHWLNGGASASALPNGAASMSDGNYLWFAFSIAGGLLLRNLIPAAYVVGPLAATAMIHVSGIELPALPAWLIVFAQISVGMNMGNRITVEDIKLGGKFGWVYFLLALLLIALSLGCGYVFAKLTNLPLATALLSLAPGGLVEMVLTAQSVGGDPSIVSSLQFIRLLLVIIVVPNVLKWAFRKFDYMT